MSILCQLFLHFHSGGEEISHYNIKVWPTDECVFNNYTFTNLPDAITFYTENRLGSVFLLEPVSQNITMYSCKYLLWHTFYRSISSPKFKAHVMPIGTTHNTDTFVHSAHTDICGYFWLWTVSHWQYSHTVNRIDHIVWWPSLKQRKPLLALTLCLHETQHMSSIILYRWSGLHCRLRSLCETLYMNFSYLLIVYLYVFSHCTCTYTINQLISYSFKKKLNFHMNFLIT